MARVTVKYDGCGHEMDFPNGDTRVFSAGKDDIFSPDERAVNYILCPFCRGLIDFVCERRARDMGVFRGPAIERKVK